MTLQQLKAILDGGKTIVDANGDKIQKDERTTPWSYSFGDNGIADPRYYWKDIEIIMSKSKGWKIKE